MALDLNPGSGLVNALLGCTRLMQGRFEEALATAAREVLPDFRRWATTMALHALGRAAESEAELSKLTRDHGDAAAYQIAEVYGYRGDVERGFEWLERAYRQRDPGLSHTAEDLLFKSLHDDTRWQPFVRKLGLM